MENENLKPVQTIPPFTKMIMTIGALPTSFYSSMSYYEAMVWLYEYLKNQVIPAVNNNGEAVEELQTAFVTLKTWIENYFENLDVQEEINKKLDEMALDGSLTELIKNYVDPIYEAYETEINGKLDEQDTEISNFKLSVNGQLDDQDLEISNFKTSINNQISLIDNKVESATTGSPKGVYSTVSALEAADPSHDYIYVVTADGKWYYYDTTLTSWTAGGDYQSTGISANSISYDNLEEELQKSFTESNTITDFKPKVLGKYIDPNGAEQTGANTCYYEITVVPGESYLLDLEYYLATFGSNNVLYMLKDNTDIIYTELSNSDKVVENRYKKIINIPTGVDTLIVNCQYRGATNTNNLSYILKVDHYKITDIHRDQFDEKIANIFTDIYEAQTPTLIIPNAYFSKESLYEFSGINIYSLTVTPGERYKITSSEIYHNPVMFFTNNNRNNTKTINDVEYTYKTINGYLWDSTDEDFVDYEFTVPDYCDTLYFNGTSADSFSISKSINYKIKVEDIDVQSIINYLNPLHEKTVLFTGDSICRASTTGVKGWTVLLKENNPSVNVYNYGQDGATIAEKINDTNNLVVKIQTMFTEHPDADYIILQGGINDSWQNLPLGTYSETDFSGSGYDTSTFSGALDYILYYALNNFKGKKIGFIITHKVYQQALTNPTYMERIRELCKKWSIPYIDLYNEGDINYNIASSRDEFSCHTEMHPTGDGCHPNLNGYKITEPKIENWLKYKL